MKKSQRLNIIILILTPLFLLLSSGALHAIERHPAGFSSIVEKVITSVVKIEAFDILGTLPVDDDLSKILNDQSKDTIPPLEKPYHKKIVSSGSGFIIDKSGLIITNNHVLDDPAIKLIEVILFNEERITAKIVGRFEKADIALLSVSIPKESIASLSAVSLANSDTILRGDWVIAIGYPFGLNTATTTVGIISAKNVIISDDFLRFIQTDASINMGNSGGPLFNTNGEVVAINTALFSPSGLNVGLGFSIPSNLVKIVTEDLRAHGYVRNRWMGVAIQNDPTSKRGVTVTRVDAQSPAGEAGLKQNDVITSLNGERVRKSSDLLWALSLTRIGDTVSITILRNGREIDFRIKIKES